MIIHGDALTELRKMESESVHCCITSPPYYGLRDYEVDGQLGLERRPEEYIEKIVVIFREVRRVLRRDGTCWVNIGDTYCCSPSGAIGIHSTLEGNRHSQEETRRAKSRMSFRRDRLNMHDDPHRSVPGIKAKNLIGIPWRVAFALQSDGWYLRQDIIWSKPNPMPESVKDRCTKSHEYVFLLSKSEKYRYDWKAIREPVSYGDHPRNGCPGPEIKAPGQRKQAGFTTRRRQGTKQSVSSGWEVGPGQVKRSSINGHRPGRDDRGAPCNDPDQGLRNKRSVWNVTVQPFRGAHFAVFPPKLVLAGCPRGGVVLDPFFGAGTAGLVAKRLGREYIGIELNPEYCEISRRRIDPVEAQGILL